VTGRRFPAAVYGLGTEPDPRFSLANERTYLAWARTSLAFVAGGVALAALPLDLHDVARRAGALVMLALGAFCAVHGFLGWARTERSLRRGEPLPGLGAGAVVSGGVLVLLVGVGVGMLL
jgi:putative membrane protein